MRATVDTDNDAASTGRAASGPLGTRELFDALASGDGGDHLRLEDLLAGLSRQVFGMLLLVSTLPAFIPIPGVGGAISGPATVLVGVRDVVPCRAWVRQTVRRASGVRSMKSAPPPPWTCRSTNPGAR